MTESRYSSLVTGILAFVMAAELNSSNGEVMRFVRKTVHERTDCSDMALEEVMLVPEDTCVPLWDPLFRGDMIDPNNIIFKKITCNATRIVTSVFSSPDCTGTPMQSYYAPSDFVASAPKGCYAEDSTVSESPHFVARAAFVSCGVELDIARILLYNPSDSECIKAHFEVPLPVNRCPLVLGPLNFVWTCKKNLNHTLPGRSVLTLERFFNDGRTRVPNASDTNSPSDCTRSASSMLWPSPILNQCRRIVGEHPTKQINWYAKMKYACITYTSMGEGFVSGASSATAHATVVAVLACVFSVKHFALPV